MSTILMPKYRIYINGIELDTLRYACIEEINVEDNASGSDLLTIKVYDPEFLFIEDKIFIEEAKIKFVGGYDNNMIVEFEGYISLLDIDFPESGSPSLTIHCTDNSHVMNRVTKKRTWENTTRAKVVKQIFAEYGFKTVIEDSGVVVDNISQNGTDIQFLTQLANEELAPYLVYLEKSTGYFVKKKVLAKQQATLDYKQGSMNILSFSPRINKEVKQVEKRTADVNLKDKAVDKAQANDNTSREVSGAPVTSTDSTSGKSTWKYNGNSAWSKTY